MIFVKNVSLNAHELDLLACLHALAWTNILRATPTAAGPSSSKCSVLWRTRGFAALGFDCCVVVGAVSGACFVLRPYDFEGMCLEHSAKLRI